VNGNIGRAQIDKQTNPDLHFDHDEEYRLVPGLEHHPRVDLGPVRTALQPAPRLGDELGIELYFKRDDSHPLGMGGNKVRQLEFYLGPAITQNADTVLITGAVQSNFVRLCAAACRRLGFHPVVQLEDRVPNNDPLYRQSGNVMLNQMFGAEIHYATETSEDLADKELDRLAQKIESQGRKPYTIHLGVEHPPLGALGYVLCAVETRLQLQALQRTPDHIVIPSGSGLTHSGFLTGTHALDWDVQVHGICVRREQKLQQTRILKRSAEAATLMQLESSVPKDRVLVHDQVLQPGYGQLNDQVHNAITRTAQLEGVLLDPVYSGRCMAGLIDLVERDRIEKGSSVVFVHTGGLPALFAYQNKLSV